MHTLGKVLAWFTVLLALGGVFVTTKVLARRNAAIAQLEKNRADYEASIAPLEEARVNLRRAQEAYTQAIHGWTPLLGANVQVGPANPGEVALNIGEASGLKVGQRVHVFVPNAQGQSVYLGPFTAKLVQGGVTTAEADFPLRAADRANWVAFVGQTTAGRVYGSVPSSGPESVLHLQQLLVRKNELLEAEQGLLAVRQKEVEIANEHLNYRNNELHGDPALQPERDTLPQFLVDGLVTAIEDTDEARNRVQAEVDDLRHRIKASYDEIVKLQAVNRELADSLPSGEATGTPASSTVGE
jgi:prefoldin subunit 5